MKTLIFSLVSFILFSAIASAQATLKTNYAPSAAAAIERAGDNKAELSKALKTVPDGQRRGLEFLISYMPEKDLRSLKAQFLLENVALAYKARSTFPWAKKVPEAIFFNDILPYAVLNERRDNWRQDFYDRFSKHVKEAKTMEEAIIAVNAAARDELKVDYSTKRKKADQSPYESMDTHMASCTGLSILLNDAFRAVGIPSRVAGIPAWTTKPGNHNWVEVWTPSNKQWQFTEYYPDKKGLNHGWLVSDAAQANPKSLIHSVYATSWKPNHSHFPMVWNFDDKSVNAVNVSNFYIKLGGADKVGSNNLCELRIDFTRNAKRISVPVKLQQADILLHSGTTPSATRDMNQFLTHKVKPGQLYQIYWQPSEGAKWIRQQIKSPKDSKFLRVELIVPITNPAE